MVSREWYQALEGQVKDWNLEQCTAAGEILNGQYNFLQRREATKQLSEFKVGQRVEFVSGKRFGVKLQGTIERINLKTVSLRECSDGRRWKVHYSFLRPVIEESAK